MGHSCTMRVIEVWYGSFMYFEGQRFGTGHSCTLRVMEVWYGSFMYFEGHRGLVWVIHIL